MEIESSIENIDEVTRKIKVNIPLERVNQEIEIAIKEAGKTAHLKGFRPGKAPKDIIEKTHGPRVRLEVANKLISSSLSDIIKEHKLDVIGNPEIDMADYNPGKPIEFTASVAIYPKPEIKGYQKLKVKIKKQEVQNADIEKALKNLQKSKATLKKIESRDIVQAGDVVDAFVSIEKDGKEEARPEHLTTEIGEGQINKDLEDAFVGMKVGELKKVPLTPPAEAKEEDKAASIFYIIDLKAISERILPELDDDFVKSLKFEPQTLLELRMEIRKNLEASVEKNKESDLHAAILEDIISKNEFKVPQVMIDNEIYNLLQRSGQIKSENEEIKIEDYRATFDEIARRRVRTAVAVDMIAEQEKIEVGEEEIKKNIQEMADSYKVSQEEMMKYLLQSKSMNGFLVEMRRSKAIESLVSKTEVEYTSES
jgi:trigger factor